MIMKLMIEEGKYYVLEVLDAPEGVLHIVKTDIGWDQKYIIHVLPKPNFLPANIFRTETLACHANLRIMQIDWLDYFLSTEATPEEAAFFESKRFEYKDKMENFERMKVETVEDYFNLLKKEHEDYLNLNVKFARVVNEYVLDNQNNEGIAHKIMAQQGIELYEISSFADYLYSEYKSSDVGSGYRDKVEQLENVVNFILEANEESYTVKFPTCYISRVDFALEPDH